MADAIIKGKYLIFDRAGSKRLPREYKWEILNRVKKKTKFNDINILTTKQKGKVLVMNQQTQLVEAFSDEYHDLTYFVGNPFFRPGGKMLNIGVGDGVIQEFGLEHGFEVDGIEIDIEVCKLADVHLKEVNYGVFDKTDIYTKQNQDYSGIERLSKSSLFVGDYRKVCPTLGVQYDYIVWGLDGDVSNMKEAEMQKIINALKSVSKPDTVFTFQFGCMHDKNILGKVDAFGRKYFERYGFAIEELYSEWVFFYAKGLK